MAVKPQFKLVANDADVTAAIQDRFSSLRLTDEAGLQSDILEIVLADHDPAHPIAMPKTGAELQLSMGYDGALTPMGRYICDEVEFCGWPATVVIRARAAIYEGTPAGKINLQTQKSRSWPNNTKLVDMVAKIAKEHGMDYGVAQSLQSITLPHYAQTEESDISFLLRILKNYDAIVKPAGGKLIVIRRGESTSISGTALPSVTIQAKDTSSFHMTISRREAPGTVVAYWHSTLKSRRNEISVGLGDPVLRIRHYFPDEDSARAAANAELQKHQRKQHRISLATPGDPSLSAESLLTLQGFRPMVDGEWLVSRVEHQLDDCGYVCHIEAEKPNDDGEAEAIAPATIPPQTVSAPVVTRTKSQVQAEFDALKLEWRTAQNPMIAKLSDAEMYKAAGDIPNQLAALKEAEALRSALNAEYSARYDQLKAELATY